MRTKMKKILCYLLAISVFITSSSIFAGSDYYELEIYKLLKNLLPYRGNAETSSFYSEGSIRIVGILPQYKNVNYGNNEIYVDVDKDIYDIRKFINHISYPLCFKPPEYFSQQDHRFLLFPMVKDYHASTMIVVFDNEKNHVLAGIFINSKDEDSYYKYIETRWNYDTYYSDVFFPHENKPDTQLSEEEFEKMSKQAIADGTNPPIDQDYIIKGWLHSRPDALVIKYKRKIPLVNASHNLQIGLGDKNCSLYSINFLEGIQKLLALEGQEVYELAKQLDEGDVSEKQQATQKLEEIFKEKLKKYLPCYYDTNLERKTLEQIKEFHIRQRWDIGSDFIKSLNLLEKARIL